jgi:probable DNA metabolism protein
MTRCIYDGSFDGFLCAAARALADAPDAGIAPAGGAQGELFMEDIPVVTDTRVSRAFLRRFASAAGREEADSLLIAQASSDPDAPGLLLKYIRRTLASGSAVAGDVSSPEILAVARIRDRVMLEINKFMGFVRFRKAGEELYYASFEPDSNIVGLIGPHFADRFRDQAFLIHDLKRGIAFWRDARRGALKSGRGSGIAEIPSLPPELSAALETNRDNVQAMWREYFKRIAIPQRRNQALQAKLMPRRYWKHLTEVQDKVKGK